MRKRQSEECILLNRTSQTLPLGLAIKMLDEREKERVATCRKATLVLGAKAEAEVNRTVESIATVFIVERE